MIDDRKALVRHIIEQPHDLAARMAYADWLEERDPGSARAELIRVQMELADIADQQCGQCHRDDRGGQHTNGPCRCSPEWRKLRRRERELLTGNYPAAYKGRPAADPKDPRNISLWAAICVAEQWRQPWPSQPAGHYGDIAARGTIRRGFVEKVETTLGAWLKYGHTLVTHQPVIEVAVRDRSVAHIGHHRWWFVMGHTVTPLDDPSWWLPNDLIEIAKGSGNWVGDGLGSGWANFYGPNSDTDAAAWLSWALVNHARIKADLPPLPPVTPCSVQPSSF